jgi:hypothetical protein
LNATGAPIHYSDLIVSPRFNRYHFARMIKALFLIFQTGEAWDRVVTAQRNLGFLLVRYLFPMMLTVAVLEGFSLVGYGRPQTGMFERIHKSTAGEAVIFEAAHSLLTLLAMVVCGVLIKILGETFHGRYTYWQTFTLVIYGLSPMFLLRLLDAVPVIIPWVTWGVGIALSIMILHQGIERVMQPAMPNALALYFMSALLLATSTGLERFVTAWYLAGHFKQLATLVSNLAAHLPF